MKLRKGQAKLFIGGREVEGVQIDEVKIAESKPAIERGQVVFSAGAPVGVAMDDAKPGEPVQIALSGQGVVKAGPWDPPQTPADPIADLKAAFEASSRQMPVSAFGFAIPAAPVHFGGATIPPTRGMIERIERLRKRAQSDFDFAVMVDEFRRLIAGHDDVDAGELRDAFDLALAIHQAVDHVDQFTIDLDAERIRSGLIVDMRAAMDADPHLQAILDQRAAAKIPVADSVTAEDVKRHVMGKLEEAVKAGIIRNPSVKVEADPTDPTVVNVTVDAERAIRRICGQCDFFERDQFGGAGVCRFNPKPVAKQAIDQCALWAPQKCASCANWARHMKAIGPIATQSSTSGTCDYHATSTDEADACDGWARKPAPITFPAAPVDDGTIVAAVICDGPEGEPVASMRRCGICDDLVEDDGHDEVFVESLGKHRWLCPECRIGH